MYKHPQHKSITAKRATPTVSQRVVAFFYHPRLKRHVSQLESGYLVRHAF